MTAYPIEVGVCSQMSTIPKFLPVYGRPCHGYPRVEFREPVRSREGRELELEAVMRCHLDSLETATPVLIDAVRQTLHVFRFERADS